MSTSEKTLGEVLDRAAPPRRAAPPHHSRLRKAVVLLCVSLILLHTGYRTVPSFAWIDRLLPGSGRLGAVASENSICSQIGINTLEKGGNAADAIIATTLCVGVVAMHHSGIGGGGFAVIRSPSGDYDTIDFRAGAPSSAYQDMFNNSPADSLVGGLASGVPGELRGLEYIYRKYATLPWKALVQPAIALARDGFELGADLDRCINTMLSSNPDNDFFAEDPSWALDFAPGGHRVKQGDRMFRRRFADTLDQIATLGPDAFYYGPIADSITKAINSKKGNMNVGDLRQFSVRQLATANITYRGHRIYGTTAPSSGAITLSTLKILEGYNDFFATDTVNLSTHRLVEAMKFAYGQRFQLGDPAFVEGLDQYQREILSEEVSRGNQAMISDDYVLDPDAYNPGGYGPSPSSGTSHIVATDWTGLSISLTTTINLWFGSQIMTDSGIILNDVMSDFSIPETSNNFGYAPSPANFIRPYKRPQSSTTPLFVEDLNGNLQLIIGAAGGSRIISSVVQSTVHVIDQELSMAEALAQPRLHNQLIPDETGVEPGYDPETMEFLRARGHNVIAMANGMSAAQGVIRQPNGTFDAAGEPRQKNSAGYSI